MSKIVNGWKGIATYFGKSSETVQKWDKDFKMPIYKIKRDLFSFESELKIWLKKFMKIKASPQ